jgi:hypothetical protein
VIGVMPRDFVFRDTRRGFWIQVTPRLRVDRGSHYLNCVAWRDHRGSDEGGFCYSCYLPNTLSALVSIFFLSAALSLP